MADTSTTNLRPSKAPNLPIAPVGYDQRYIDVLNNALRLYFTQIDNYTFALSDGNGGKYLEFPHIAAQGADAQYAAANNTATKVLWTQLDSGSGFTLNPDGSATAEQTGIYKIDYSLQFVNTSNTNEVVWVWLRVNGVDVAGSASKFTVPARKSVGNDGYLVAYSSVVYQMNAADYVELYWATSLAYNTVGPVDGVYMEAYPAITSPLAVPSTPAAIGSITFVSAIIT